MMTQREIEREQAEMEIERKHAWASRQIERLIVLSIGLLVVGLIVCLMKG
jgi:hypothetical protein